MLWQSESEAQGPQPPSAVGSQTSPISVQRGQAVLPLELPPVPLALPLEVVPEAPGLLEQPRALSANTKVTRGTLKIV